MPDRINWFKIWWFDIICRSFRSKYFRKAWIHACGSVTANEEWPWYQLKPRWQIAPRLWILIHSSIQGAVHILLQLKFDAANAKNKNVVLKAMGIPHPRKPTQVVAAFSIFKPKIICGSKKRITSKIGDNVGFFICSNILTYIRNLTPELVLAALNHDLAGHW